MDKFSYIEQNGKTSYGVVSLVVDKEADVNSLPQDVAPGSTCFVIENSSAYMFKVERGWEPLD